MPDVVITRVQHSGPPRRSRNLEERLAVRLPSLAHRVAGLVFRLLGPRSRLRRAFLRRALLSGWASFDRGDFELNLLFFAPDAELEFPSGMQTLGLANSFRGHERRIEALNEIIDVWGVSEFAPAYILDLNDRLLCLGFWRAQARTSGVALEQEFAQLVTVTGGLVVRDQLFFSWQEGLQAVGLEPDSVVLPSRGRTSQARTNAES